MLDPDELKRVGNKTAQSASKATDLIVQYLASLAGESLQDDVQAALARSVDVPANVLRILGSNPIARNNDALQEYRSGLLASARADARALGLTSALSAFEQENDSALDWLITNLDAFKRRCNLSMANDALNSYQGVVREILPQVQGGILGREQAVQLACKKLAERGVCVVSYASGRRDQADVAVRRHIQTQLRQAATNSTLSACERLGVVLVEVSSHVGARPTHQLWQGRVYGLHGACVVDGVKYEGLKESGAYDGLQEPNCRHSVAPYASGRARRWSATPDKDAGLDPKATYSATQRQRYNERKIRAAKREALACKEAGVDDTAARLRLGNAQKAQRQLLSENEWLKRRSEREVVSGAQDIRGITSVANSSERFIAAKAKGTATDVVRKAVNGKAYRAKFDNLGVGKKAGQSLYNQAKRMLNDCDGTPYERLVVISRKNGRVIADTFSYEPQVGRSGLASREYDKVRASGEKVVFLHNHPHSTPPSWQDFETISKSEWLDTSVIVCHDGTVYAITCTDRAALKETMEYLFDTMADRNPSISSSREIQDMAIDELIKGEFPWLRIKNI